jgi:N-acyl-L-homoserine lactone synthetase
MQSGDGTMYISRVSRQEIGLWGDRGNMLRQDRASIEEMVSRPAVPDFVPANSQSYPSAVPQAANDAAAHTRTHSRKPSLTEAIAMVRRNFVVEAADTSESVLAAQRLRYQVYCVERGYEKSDSGIEQDEFDIRSRHLVLRRRSDGAVVGTTRLVLYNPALPGDSYPTQRVCDASLLHCLPMPTTAEISRFAISKQLRGSSPALIRLALMEGVVRVSQPLGLTDWCATMEPCLLRLLQPSGIHFRPLGPLVEYHGLRQPCCANIRELLARMRAERPEIWAFVTNDGQYYGDTSAPATNSKPLWRNATDWRATISQAARFAFFPTFEAI